MARAKVTDPRRSRTFSVNSTEEAALREFLENLRSNTKQENPPIVNKVIQAGTGEIVSVAEIAAQAPVLVNLELNAKGQVTVPKRKHHPQCTCGVCKSAK